MNVLLTTSAAPEKSPFSTDEKRPPLGMGFLISVLEQAGHRVFFIDNYLKPSNFLETNFVIKNNIDYVGIYANTICYRDTLKMFKGLQRLREQGKWKGKIIVGGPHTTVAVETVPDFVDFIVQGEGEQAILDIVNGKTTERVIRYPRIQNLDTLPMPAWDYFVNLPYDFTTEWFNDRPVFVMNTSRGCPFKCSFCSVGSIWGKNYTYFSAERIVDGILYLIKKYHAKGIYFREDNFTLMRDRAVDFCELLLKKNIKIKWVCESRVDTLDRGLIPLMAKAGCKGFYFGIESGSQRILDFLKKGITISQVEKVFKWCRKAGIKTYGSFIVGVPTETEKERIETVYFTKKIKSTIYSINIFVGIPRSELYEYVINNNLYQYIDDIGLVYLNWHNYLVDEFYGGKEDAKIPCQSGEEKYKGSEIEGTSRRKLAYYCYFSGRALFGNCKYSQARKKFIQSISQFPFVAHFWLFYLLTFFPQAIVKQIREMYKVIKDKK